jgi:hypothetical protein
MGGIGEEAEHDARASCTGDARTRARRQTCGVVAKTGQLRQLEEIVAAHPRIHSGEGLFYCDILCAAAEAAGMRARLIAPSELDARDARLLAVGRRVGNLGARTGSWRSWRRGRWGRADRLPLET